LLRYDGCPLIIISREYFLPEELNRGLPKQLFWVEDAPMFTDAVLIERCYDAVVSPEHKQGNIGLKINHQTIEALKSKFELEASVTTEKLAPLLAPLFAFIKPTLKGSGAVEGNSQSTLAQESTIELEPISTPQRQLKQLALHYLINHSSRVFFEDNPSRPAWHDPTAIDQVPRLLVFLSLPSIAEAAEKGIPQAKLIPTAAEFADGAIVQLYKNLNFGSGAPLPDYPERGSVEQLRVERKVYWKWFENHFSATKAMVAVEEAASKHGRIRWIDYRLPISVEGDTLHLHLSPGGAFDTGVLAYNFIKRGFKHGIRLVGTLKSEPDMNVLAVYDR
jgi:hypothetical protein